MQAGVHWHNPLDRIDFSGCIAIVRAASEAFAPRGRRLPGAVPLPISWRMSLITPAFAQGAATPSGDMILQFVPFVLIFVIMWFLIIRPQQRRVREHREMINNVRRGDTVVTSGGIVGKVTRVVEDAGELEVEIADGVKVKLVRGMISEVRTKGEPVKT